MCATSPGDVTASSPAGGAAASRASKLAETLELGRKVFEMVEVERRELGAARRALPIRVIAERLDAAPGTSSVWRALAIHRLAERYPELRDYRHVGVGHVSVLLAVPAPLQLDLLRYAEGLRWSRRKLEDAVRCLRERGERARVARVATPLERDAPSRPVCPPREIRSEDSAPRPERPARLAKTLELGRKVLAIVESLGAGAGGAKRAPSFRSIAEQLDEPRAVSSVTAWRALAIYRLAEQYPELRQFRHVGVGHMALMLSVPAPFQIDLLRCAERMRWSRREIEAALECSRKRQERTGAGEGMALGSAGPSDAN
jgi:hypothetical protein